MDQVLLGNILSFLASAIMVLGGFIKSKKRLLTVQIFMFALFTAANLTLGAVTGAITNSLSIVRNLVTLCTEFTLPFKVAFAAAEVILCAVFNKVGLIGWLPAAAVCLYTWSLSSKNLKTIKLAIILTQALWFVYDLYYKNYISTAFDVFTILSNVIGIRMLLKDEKKSLEN